MPLFIYRAINIISMFYNMLVCCKALIVIDMYFCFLALSELVLYFSNVSISHFTYIYVGK
jgi:hypothetical protein